MNLWVLLLLVAVVVAKIDYDHLAKYYMVKQENSKLMCRKHIAKIRNAIVSSIIKEYNKMGQMDQQQLPYTPKTHEVMIYNYWNEGWGVEQGQGYNEMWFPGARAIILKNLHDIDVTRQIAQGFLRQWMPDVVYQTYRQLPLQGYQRFSKPEQWLIGKFYGHFYGPQGLAAVEQFMKGKSFNELSEGGYNKRLAKLKEFEFPEPPIPVYPGYSKVADWASRQAAVSRQGARPPPEK